MLKKDQVIQNSYLIYKNNEKLSRQNYSLIVAAYYYYQFCLNYYFCLLS